MSDNVFVWDNKYSVDFKLIDNQHKQLVNMTNELFKASKNGITSESRTILKKTIRGAIEYAQVHFYTEEKYMTQVKYPELASHKAEHGAFVIKVLQEVKKFEEGNAELVSLANFLKDWLLQHIAGSDKRYAPYLKNVKG